MQSKHYLLASMFASGQPASRQLDSETSRCASEPLRPRAQLLQKLRGSSSPFKGILYGTAFDMAPARLENSLARSVRLLLLVGRGALLRKPPWAFLAQGHT